MFARTCGNCTYFANMGGGSHSCQAAHDADLTGQLDQSSCPDWEDKADALLPVELRYTNRNYAADALFPMMTAADLNGERITAHDVQFRSTAYTDLPWRRYPERLQEADRYWRQHFRCHAGITPAELLLAAGHNLPAAHDPDVQQRLAAGDDQAAIGRLPPLAARSFHPDSPWSRDLDEQEIFHFRARETIDRGWVWLYQGEIACTPLDWRAPYIRGRNLPRVPHMMPPDWYPPRCRHDVTASELLLLNFRGDLPDLRQPHAIAALQAGEQLSFACERPLAEAEHWQRLRFRSGMIQGCALWLFQGDVICE